MAKRKTITVHAGALNAQNAVQLVRLASGFASMITLETGGKQVNAKSLMGVMTLGAELNGTLLLYAQGRDEAEAVEAMEKFFG